MISDVFDFLLGVDPGLFVAIFASLLSFEIALSAAMAYYFSKKLRYKSATTAIFFAVMGACSFLYLLADFVVTDCTAGSFDIKRMFGLIVLAIIAATLVGATRSGVAKSLETKVFHGFAVLAFCAFLFFLIVPLYTV